MPHIIPSKVRDAVLAHALAVIDGFGTDRIQDRQIETTPELEELLSRVREARDLALQNVIGSLGDAETDFGLVHREMLEAIRFEQRMMAARAPVSFSVYEKMALAKTAIGLPASIALARHAGWSRSECKTVVKCLSSVWLGMQYHDDAIDWEDDFRRESAWAVLLARSLNPEEPFPQSSEEARKVVLSSGIIAQMLDRSFRNFRAARKRADVLGARELAAWARTKEEHALGLAEQERNNAGYAVRLYVLSPWVDHVLS